MKLLERAALLFMGMALAAVIAVFSFMEKDTYQGESHLLNEGWCATVSEKDGTQDENTKTVALPTNLHISKNEQAVLSIQLPSAFSREQTLGFRNILQNTRVYLDDQLLYEYTVPKQQIFGKCPPDTWNAITIPAESDGKILSIERDSPYYFVSGCFPEIFYGDRDDIIYMLGIRHIFPAMMSAVIFFYGLVMMTRFYMLYHFAEYKEIFWFGLFLVFVAIYIYCTNELYGLFIGNSFVQQFCGNMAGLFIPVSYALYIIKRGKGRNDRRLVIQKILLIGTLVMMVIGAAAQAYGLFDLVELMPVVGCIVFVQVLVQAITEIMEEGEMLAKFPRIFCSFFLDAMLIVEGILIYTGKMTFLSYPIVIGGLLYMWQESSVLSNVAVHEITETTEEKGKIKDAQMQLMLSQIQPHFIFNALNTIRFLTKTEPDTAYEMIYDFSKYLRGNFDSLSEEVMIPFQKEMDHVEAYLNIEQKRFADKIDVRIDLRELAFEVPALSVLALVENAVKHGIRKRPEGGYVSITTWKKNNQILIQVENDGAGFDGKKQGPEDRPGLERVQYNLSRTKAGTLHVESHPGRGTKAIIRIDL